MLSKLGLTYPQFLVLIGLRSHATEIHCDMDEALGLDAAELAAPQSTLRQLTASVTR